MPKAGQGSDAAGRMRPGADVEQSRRPQAAEQSTHGAAEPGDLTRNREAYDEECNVGVSVYRNCHQDFGNATHWF
jgi:hypothetical protein